MTIINIDESESDVTSLTFTLNGFIPPEAQESVSSSIEYIYPEADESDISVSGDRLRISVAYAEKMDRAEIDVLCASIEQAVQDYFSTKSKLLTRMATKLEVEILHVDTEEEK